MSFKTKFTSHAKFNKYSITQTNSINPNRLYKILNTAWTFNQDSQQKYDYQNKLLMDIYSIYELNINISVLCRKLPE